MTSNSLAFRLLLSAAAWTLMIVSITAAILISICRTAIDGNFNTDLNRYLDYMVRQSVSQGSEEPKRPDNLGEPAFAQYLSGYYWQIRPVGKNADPLYRSESLFGETFSTPSDLDAKPDARQYRHADVPGPEGQILRAVERELALPHGAEFRSYSFSVAVDPVEVEYVIQDLTTTIVIAMGLLGAGLLLATFFQVRFGLSPIRDLQLKLAAIRSGEETKLDGLMPAEIAPLQGELNALLEANLSVVERARTHVGNLAHALKTPLSVIINEATAHNGELSEKVTQQATIMRSQISHYLDRARIAAQIRSINVMTDVGAELEALSRALGKIHGERGITITLRCEGTVKFAGEKQDFDEMAGNLMDNACKWAKSTIAVEVFVAEAKTSQHEKTFTVTIDDDGPGLPEEFRQSAVRRGRRLDENVPGSGLGLSIVADLSHLYHGSLHLEEAPTRGLRARLVLPAS